MFQSASGEIAMSQDIKRPDPSVAAKALAEAEARRVKSDAAGQNKAMPKEIGGRGGEDPVRYGDWEAKGIAHDF
jgi:hypothetical protein